MLRRMANGPAGGEPPFFQAYEQALQPLFAAADMLEVIARTQESGLLEVLATSPPASEVAQRAGLDDSESTALIRALVAGGVAEVDDAGALSLAPAWRSLTGPAAFVPLSVALAQNAVARRLLRGGAETYWSLSRDDRLTFARAVSPDPFSDGLVAGVRNALESEAGDEAELLDGGRLLELGCGVAGRILTYLRAVPTLSAVGVELSEDLAAEAERRAAELGLSDRFRVVCCDAADFEDDEPFDHGFWSQFFFPTHARAGTLATMLRCVRPGGRVLAPLGVDHAALREDPQGLEARDYATFRVVLASWGVPERDETSLASELEEAGFTDVRVVRRVGAPHPGVQARVPAQVP
jgi:SAM-dependent methyltransferase